MINMKSFIIVIMVNIMIILIFMIKSNVLYNTLINSLILMLIILILYEQVNHLMNNEWIMLLQDVRLSYGKIYYYSLIYYMIFMWNIM